MKLEPAGRLHSSAFVRDTLHRVSRVGVEDISKSKGLPALRDMLDIGKIDGFSHGDPNRIVGIRTFSNVGAPDLARYKDYESTAQRRTGIEKADA